MLPDVIETQHFHLRPFRLEDVEAVLAYAREDEFLRYLPIAMPYGPSDAERFLAKQIFLDRQLNPSWAIEVQGVVSGGLNIRFFAEHRVAEIGYAVARRLWGNGLATEAARTVVTAAFATYEQLKRVRATADARNAASIRVMEKLGMKREGLLRANRLCRGELTDEVVYGALRAEWYRRHQGKIQG